MQTANKLFLVGIGYRPLGKQTQTIVRNADVLLASSRLLDVFTRYDEYVDVKDHIKIIDKVPDTIEFIRTVLRTSNTKLRTIVLLASGDPLFFGIGRRMLKEFGSEMVEIIPDLSSMQQAFSKINVPWDDAFCISVHGGPDIAKRRTLPYEVSDIPKLLAQHKKMAILTDRVNSPALIARTLVSSGQDASRIIMHVCERLGYDDERIRSGMIGEIALLDIAEPNVVILQQSEGRNQEKSIVFGLKEAEIAHARGLITKDEVRAVAIHKLRLPEQGVMWDIGAGSGSVSVEAAKVCPGMNIFAIERDDEQVGYIRDNAAKFQARNIEIILGSALDVLAGLPAPNRVFIGGSGGQLEAIIDHIQIRMTAGIIVVNAVTLETLNQAVAGLEKAGLSVAIAEVSVSRSRIVAAKRHMTAQNPIFIVTGEKREHAG